MGDVKQGKKQRSITNIFIDTTFQFKIILLVTGFIVMQAVLTIWFFIITYNLFLQDFLSIVSQNSELIHSLKTLKVEILTGIVVIGVGFIVSAIIISIHFSHKMAGPSYAIKRAIHNLMDGVEHHSINLRKGDEFHDLAQRINTVFSDYHLVKKEGDEDE